MTHLFEHLRNDRGVQQYYLTFTLWSTNVSIHSSEDFYLSSQSKTFYWVTVVSKSPVHYMVRDI